MEIELITSLMKKQCQLEILRPRFRSMLYPAQVQVDNHPAIIGEKLEGKPHVNPVLLHLKFLLQQKSDRARNFNEQCPRNRGW